MAAQGSIKDWFTFVQGLNTEGGYFNTPANSWVDGDNIIPNTDGSIERRNGLDYEVNFTYPTYILPPNFVNGAYAIGYWKEYVIIQQGIYLAIYENISGTISPTFVRRIDLRSYKADKTTIANPVTGLYPCSFAVAYGALIVTNPEINPISIEYTGNPNALFAVSEIEIKIRDFNGWPTTAPLTDEKTEAEWLDWFRDNEIPDNYLLSTGGTAAIYNLKNQGWNDAQINTYKTANSNKLPANSKSWIYGKDSSDNFDATLLNKQDFGTSPAPKGRFILDLFSQDRGIEKTIKYNTRFSNTAFFAGRAWYAGALDDDIKANVYFSQTLTDLNKVGKCYQENDPTSEVISDLIDSDGGVIAIPEAGAIAKLEPLGRGLLVIAENGIYSISGVDGVFSASNYQVEKVSSVGCIAPQSVVTVENQVVYWSPDGVYAVQADQSGFTYNTSSVSESSIRTYLSEIPFNSRKHVQGVYNPTSKEIYWLYSSTQDVDPNVNRYKKDRVLGVNLQLNSWFTFTLTKTDTTYARAVFVTEERNTGITSNTVVNSSGDTVIDSLSNEVTSAVTQTLAGKKQFKFVCQAMEDTLQYQYNLVENETYYYSPIPSEIANLSNQTYKGASQYVNNKVFIILAKDRYLSTPFSSTLVSWSFDNNTNTFIEASYKVYNLSDSNALHTGFGAHSFSFNLDGTRLYVSQRDPTTASTQFGYYTLTTAYDTDTITGFTSLVSYLVSDPLVEDILYSQFRITSSGMYTMRGGLTTTTCNKYNTPSDGNINTFPVGIASSGLISYSAKQSMNYFEYLNDGNDVQIKYVPNLITPTTELYQSTVVHLDVPYDITKLNFASIDDYIYTYTPYYIPSDVLFINTTKQQTRIIDVDQSYLNSYLYVRVYSFPYYKSLDGIGSHVWDNDRTLNGISFADLNNERDTSTKFKDWYSYDNIGTEKEAYITTGYQLADVGPARQKTGMYLTTYAKRTETVFDENGEPVNPSSILMQMRWDFTDNYASGKWSVPVETYRQTRPYLASAGDTFDDGYPLVISKSKMRGRGKAVQFKFSSNNGHDFKLYGWTGTFTGNTNV